MKKDQKKSLKFKRPSDNHDLYFVFNIEGEPVSYRQLQYRYNKAMANIVRQSMGLDAAQAVGGWKSREVVEKVYTDNMPAKLNKSAVENVQKIMRNLSLENN